MLSKSYEIKFSCCYQCIMLFFVKGTPGLSDGLEILATARNYLLEGDIQQEIKVLSIK